MHEFLWEQNSMDSDFLCVYFLQNTLASVWVKSEFLSELSIWTSVCTGGISAPLWLWLVIWPVQQVPGWSYLWTAAMAMIMATGRMGGWSTSLPLPQSTMETWRRSFWTHSMSRDRAAQEAALTVTALHHKKMDRSCLMLRCTLAGTIALSQKKKL